MEVIIHYDRHRALQKVSCATVTRWYGDSWVRMSTSFDPFPIQKVELLSGPPELGCCFVSIENTVSLVTEKHLNSRRCFIERDQAQRQGPALKQGPFQTAA